MGGKVVLQGGRDYQVTVDDYLARWKRGLAGHPAADFRIYEADNHQFIPGEGRSTPEDYGRADHVDRAVVVDIADWIAAKLSMVSFGWGSGGGDNEVGTSSVGTPA
ncbi:hypothetical protein [Glycomyces rhizosphaerae]|uniref:Dienelactone hydrolase domain-containing protein n=1 Tax=Glycomyces rhizosphaerae TaxID=2054422 RepID=A0ABV7PZM6_9ACTN